MLKHFILRFVILFGCAITGCQSQQITFFPEEPVVRVRLIYTEAKISFETAAPALLITEGDTLQADGGKFLIDVHNGRLRVTLPDNSLIQSRDLAIFPEGSITIFDVPFGIGWWWGGSEDRRYTGRFSALINENGKPDLVLHLPLETYLKGVVPYEIGSDSPLEALKAQAVAARSEIAQALLTGKYSGGYFDICADVECQVYAGDNRRTAHSDSAITLTRGEVLQFEGQVIDAYYASNCGGKSERVEKVWPWRGGSRPYLVSRADADDNLTIDPQLDIRPWLEHPPTVFCNPEIQSGLPSWSRANFRWKREVLFEAFDPAFSGADSLEILERGESGRLHRVRVWNESRYTDLGFELAIRQIVNPPLRSSAFVYSRTDSSWIFEGAGWGHGVGMCQSGAIARALQGRDYRHILGHYFPGTQLVRVID